MGTSSQPTRRPTTHPTGHPGRRPNWGVGVVALLGVNILADLVLGRHGTDGGERAILVVLWAAWWVLVVVTVVAAVRRARARA